MSFVPAEQGRASRATGISRRGKRRLLNRHLLLDACSLSYDTYPLHHVSCREGWALVPARFGLKRLVEYRASNELLCCVLAVAVCRVALRVVWVSQKRRGETARNMVHRGMANSAAIVKPPCSAQLLLAKAAQAPEDPK